jgi:hypothetical protein
MVVALGFLMLLGRSVLALCVRNLELRWTERWSLSFLLGCGGISLLTFWGSPLFGLIPAQWLLSVVTSGLALFAWWQTARVSVDLPHFVETPTPWVLRMLILGIAMQAVALMLVALQTPLGWDGLMNFEMKARIAFANDPSGRLPLSYLSDTSRTWSHARYPLLVPLTEHWVYAWIGTAHQGLIKPLFPAFYLSLAGLFYGVSCRLMPRTHALAGVLILGFVPSLAIGPGAAISGYADVPLAASAFGAIAFAYLGLRTGTRDYIVLSALLLSVAVWTKREGLLLAAYVLVAVAIAIIARNRQSASSPAVQGVGWLVLLPALVLGPWEWLHRSLGAPDGDFLPVSLEMLSAHVSRVPTVALLLARELTLLGHWALLWPVFAVTVLLSTRRLRDISEQFLLGAVIIPLGLYVFIFVFSSWPDFTEHVGTALPRLIIPLAPVALFSTVCHLGDCLFPSEPFGRAEAS